MSERLRLAEHFVANHGQAAARALEEMPVDVAGGLIDTIADPVSNTALKAMLPYHAAKCLCAISPEAASKYLASMLPRDAATILRHTDEASRKNLIDLLPRHQAVRVLLILGYPQSLVGAWMDPLTPSLPISGTVAEARTRLAREDYEHGVVFVVDDGNRVRGVVPLAHLVLQANENASLSSVIRNGPKGLFAATSLENAVTDKGWADYDTLPVIDRNGHFIGVLRFAELRAALARPSLADRTASGGDDLFGLTEACYLGLADLMAASLADERDRLVRK